MVGRKNIGTKNISLEKFSLSWTVRGRLSSEFWDNLWRSLGNKEMVGPGLHIEKSISGQQHNDNLGSKEIL